MSNMTVVSDNLAVRRSVAVQKLAAIQAEQVEQLSRRYGLNGEDDLRFPSIGKGWVKSYSHRELAELEAASVLPGIECVGPQCVGLHVGVLNEGDHFFCVCGTSYLRYLDSDDPQDLALDIWHDRQRQIVRKPHRRKHFAFPGSTTREYLENKQLNVKSSS